MKYKHIGGLSQEKRAEINEKILTLIRINDIKHLPKDAIYAGYSGEGGLHGLKRKDFDSYHAFAEAKKEIEQGQFFTPHDLVDVISQQLNADPSELVCDLTCGKGSFFNFFNEVNCYGCDQDEKATTVARFLFPDAKIVTQDIRFYDPFVQFDYVVGNPPFNLRWDVDGTTYVSQLYYCIKAASLLKPGGLMIIVVPSSFLADDFADKTMIETVNESFNFICQYEVNPEAFKEMGVTYFPTKVLVMQRKAESLSDIPYEPIMVDMDQATDIIAAVQQQRHQMRVKLRSEWLQHGADTFYSNYGISKKDYDYKVRKYLYELKTHKILNAHYTTGAKFVEEFITQKQPKDMTDKEWQHAKLTPFKVLSYLKRLVNKQNDRHEDRGAWVRRNYSIYYKAYSPKEENKLQRAKGQRTYLVNRIVQLDRMQDIVKPFRKALYRRQRLWQLVTTPIKELSRNEAIDKQLDKFVFFNGKGEKCKFNEKQKADLGLVVQRPYTILNWQQGSGKTAAAAFWMYTVREKVSNTFIIGPAVAINMTWVDFLKLHKKDFIQIKSLQDVYAIRKGQIVIMSMEFLDRYKRHIKKYIRTIGYKAALVFDESDSITNNTSKRTRAALYVFRKVRYKLLTTGTTTRNNITELYSQLELMYNNSLNMLCKSQFYYITEVLKKNECIGDDAPGEQLKRRQNPYWQQPFPPKGGQLLFQRCFNPQKSTVFGIKKNNQDLYNIEDLKTIVEHSIITRTFKDVAGDKYTIHHIDVNQTPAEEEVYRVIIEELSQIIHLYYNSTGNSRKDAGLRLVRQMQLLIKATSVPQDFVGYDGDFVNSKASSILNQLQEHSAEKVAIGCTTIDAVEYYVKVVGEAFPFRKLFKIVGEVEFEKRRKMVAEYEATPNGILIATQQALSSSVNIPTCDYVIIESKQWNIPRIEQFYFRFIRYDSVNITKVVFMNYYGTIEMNLMALLLNKERLNDFIKTLEYVDDSDIYEEFGVDLDILNAIITKEKDEDGKMRINWGQAKLVS